MSKMEKKKGEMGLMTGANMEMVGRDGITATATSTSTTTSDDGHGHGPPLRSETSSSIGQPDDDDDDDTDDDEEVQSTLSSLASLEDSLPIKKGLSKFYGGKSKSYGNLGEVRSLDDLGKSDNPFNKRRRTLLAYNLMFRDRDHHNNTTTTTTSHKQQQQQHLHSSSAIIHKRTSNKAALFYAHSNHISMPLLSLAEDHDEDYNNDYDNDNDNGVDDSSDDYYATPTTSSFLPPPPSLQQHQPYPSRINHTPHPTVNAAITSAAAPSYFPSL